MSRRKGVRLKLAGKTTDKKLVVRGVFEFYETYGLPLDMIVDKLRCHDMIVDWMDFMKRAEAAGWNRKSTVERLKGVIGDVYGPKFRDEWLEKLNAQEA